MGNTEELPRLDGERMNSKVKEQWLIALRSGKYQQTKEVLKDGVGYCCLGVLCDILNDKMGNWSEEDDTVYIYEIDESETELPNRLRVELGIEDGIETALIHMNDEGKSFDIIANYIEENL